MAAATRSREAQYGLRRTTGGRADRSRVNWIAVTTNMKMTVGDNLGGPILPDTVFPARMLVDHVRLYQPEAT